MDYIPKDLYCPVDQLLNHLVEHLLAQSMDQ